MFLIMVEDLEVMQSPLKFINKKLGDNMRTDLNDVKIEPLKNSISPEIIFNIPVYYKANYEMPIESTGIIFSEDGKKISDIIEVITDTSFELAARQRNDQIEKKTTISMVAKLDSIALDHIEQLRSKNHKGNIKFNLEINIKTLKSRSLLSYMNFLGSSAFKGSFPDHQKDANIVIYLDSYKRSSFSSERKNMWILSGDDSPTFLEMTNFKSKGEVTIHFDEWLHDFCPVLQIGKFAVFEFQIPENIEGRGDLSERINEAIKAIEKMEENLKKSEWNQVIEDSRHIWELLRNVDEIKDLLQRDGYTEEAINELFGYIDKNSCKHSGSIGNLFNFSSKFHHKIGLDKKLKPDIKASKEDAYLIYTTGLAFLSMVSKKIQRLGV